MYNYINYNSTPDFFAAKPLQWFGNGHDIVTNGFFVKFSARKIL